jgi:Tol biopolymer transport system component
MKILNMKKIITLLLTVLPLLCSGQQKGFDYFGLESPGDSIRLFAPGLVSLENSVDGSLAISPDGDEIFFSGGKQWPESKVMHLEKIGGRWTKPEVASFSVDCYAAEPAFSPDGRYLYYSSSKGSLDISQYCIWRVEKVGNRWGNAIKVIDVGGSDTWEFHPSVTKDGTVYFCCWNSLENVGSIYKSECTDGIYSEPEKVNVPFNAKSSITNPFVDPDGRYIIVAANKYEGKNDYDAYVSYRGNDGSWQTPINLGEKINTPGDDDSVDISPDGDFLFLYRQNDIYWTETKNILKPIPTAY